MAYTLAEREELYTYIYEAAKDAFGTRSAAPSRARMEIMTDAELDADVDYYEKAVARSIKEDEERHAEAEAAWGVRVAEVIAAGAGDETTAIRWILDGDGVTDYDLVYGPSYLAYKYGTSYGFFNGKPIPKVDFSTLAY